MNLFEIFVKLTHMHIRGLWEETTATFTGKTRKATVTRRRRIVEADYDAYEISYFADEKKICSWHTFHPLPDPDPKMLMGTKIRIRYKKTKPQYFEIIPDHKNI
ncbi:MAG: hypothetical protein K6F87_01060 [Lachnospiraceae bacterium]|nr:hypothetical protein [Lachnospiraceae bacterium]